MRVLLIDNYDSFTFNLYQLCGALLESRVDAGTIDVVRNDQLTLDEIKSRAYDRIIISPGPGDPADKKYFGVCSEIITKLGPTVPVLGVCLGMQGIAYYFGGRVVRASKPMHGKTSIISHTGQGIFRGLPQQLEVMRYHSLVVDPEQLPACLEITASTEGAAAGEIMGLHHREYPIEGVQFHPESFATEGGREIMRNFLNYS